MAASSYEQPIRVGSVDLKHRTVMSAMTRTRGHYKTGVPSDLMVEYYSQRASDGGLLISEGVSPCAMGVCYLRGPGIWTEDQVEGWRRVVDAVHKRGAKIFCQLMYAGRVTHKSLLVDNRVPYAPSAVKPKGLHHIEGGKSEYDTPQAATIEDIAEIVDEFVFAAKQAMKAGFNGVEIHSGNGYIFQQFLAKSVNQRGDAYGGSIDARSKFLLDTIDACTEAIGADHVAVKLQPGVTFSDIVEPQQDILEQACYLGPELEKRKLAYVCFSSLNKEPYCFFAGLEGPNINLDVFKEFRSHYKGVLMINGAISPKQGAEYLGDGTADLIAFGVLFLSNSNLPALIKAGKELNKGGENLKVWYGKEVKEITPVDAEGYTDWPLVEV